MNQAIHKCLDKKFKSFYLQVDERTDPLTSALVKNLNLPTYRVTNDPVYQGDEQPPKDDRIK